MILEISLAFLLFFLMRFSLSRAKRSLVLPLYLLLFIRLIYWKPVYSSFSLWQPKVYQLSQQVVVAKVSSWNFVWLIGSILLLGLSFIQLGLLHEVLPKALNKGKIRFVSARSPFTIGTIQPLIGLPEGLGDTEKDLILLHEMTHIRRGHNWMKLIMHLFVIIFWWHPAIWLTQKLLNLDLEMDCDEASIAKLSPKEQQHYAHILLKFSRATETPLALSMGSHPIKRRIKRLLQPASQPLVLSLLLIIGLGLITIPVLTHSRPILIPPQAEANVSQPDPNLSDAAQRLALEQRARENMTEEEAQALEIELEAHHLAMEQEAQEMMLKEETYAKVRQSLYDEAYITAEGKLLIDNTFALLNSHTTEGQLHLGDFKVVGNSTSYLPSGQLESLNIELESVNLSDVQVTFVLIEDNQTEEATYLLQSISQ